MPYAVFSDRFLSDGAKLTYAALRYLAPDFETCIASLIRLAQIRGVSLRTLERHLRQLEAGGAIATEATSGKASRYVLHAEKCSLSLRRLPPTNLSGVPPTNLSGDPRHLCQGSLKSVGTTSTFQEQYPPPGGYGGAAAELTTLFPQGAGDRLLPDLVAACQALDPDITDGELAALIRRAWQPNQRSPGLFLYTVPRLVESLRRKKSPADPVPQPRPTATCGACYAGMLGGEHDSTLAGVRGAVQHGARLCECELGRFWSEMLEA